MVSVAKGDLTVRLILLLLVVKLSFTALRYGSGSPGGIFFPLLVLGALIGRAYSDIDILGTLYLPQEFTVNFVILGMTAFFSAVVKAPITGSILLAEMVGSLQHFTSLVTISAISYLASEILKTRPIYELFLERLLRKGIIPSTTEGEGERKILLSIPINQRKRRVRSLSFCLHLASTFTLRSRCTG